MQTIWTQSSAFKIFGAKNVFNRHNDFLSKHKSIWLPKNNSTEFAVNTIMTKITNAFENKEIAYSIFLDFVNHQILLSKLEHYGVRGMFKFV